MSSVDMSKHFTTADLLRYTAPSMVMMVFTSIYTIVDGFFVSNFAGKSAFAAVNLIMPFIMILSTVGFMVGSGGGALVAHQRGAGNEAKANSYFSLIIWFALVLGITCALIGFFAMEPVARLLGASDELLPTCVLYGRISMVSLPLFILQYAFQPLFSTAGKPTLGLVITVLSGCTNIVLDFVLVGWLNMGVAGAAWATVASEYVGGLLPLIYFLMPNSSFLRLGKAQIELRVIAKTCANGSSEMMTNIAMSVVAILYNWQLIKMLGEDGVAAYGVIMYVGMIFGAVLMGYAMGSAPLMSYQNGADNRVEKRSLLRHGLAIMGIGGVVACAAAQLLAPLVASVFTSYDANLMALTVHAFRLYSIAFCLMGFSTFGSSLFTSLGNGVVSAVISFARTLIFEAGAVMLLPMVLGADGIWLSVLVAEIASTTLVFACILGFGRFYGLRKPKGE